MFMEPLLENCVLSPLYMLPHLNLTVGTWDNIMFVSLSSPQRYQDLQRLHLWSTPSRLAVWSDIPPSLPFTMPLDGEGYCITIIIQMRKLRLWEVKKHAKDHSDHKIWSLLPLVPDWGILTVSWYSPSAWGHCSSYTIRWPENTQGWGVAGETWYWVSWPGLSFPLLIDTCGLATVKPADLMLAGTHQQF